MAAPASTVIPEKRNMKFKLDPALALNWHPTAREATHVVQFFNAMSVFFPRGELFFINSIQAYKAELKDAPAPLKEAIAGFIYQESIHGREHEHYNSAIKESGMPVAEHERVVERLLSFVERRLPRALNLAATVGLEHLTAVLGDSLLRNEVQLAGADERYAKLWLWHAIEETEHKAVSYDAFLHVTRDWNSASVYALRLFAFGLVNVIFWPLMIFYHFRYMLASGGAFNPLGWLLLLRWHWLSPGILRQALVPFLDFFRPGFHPWDHDNRAFIEAGRIRALVDSVNAYAPAAAAGGAGKKTL